MARLTDLAKKLLRRLPDRAAGAAFWLAATVTAAAAVRLAAPRAGYSPHDFITYADRAEALFHGVLDGGIAFSMPLLSALVSLSTYHGLPGMDLISRALLPGIYLLAYALGAAGGGLGLRRARAAQEEAGSGRAAAGVLVRASAAVGKDQRPPL